MSVQLVDTHSHVDYIHRAEGPKPYDGIETHATQVLARAESQGVRWVLNPSVEPARFADVMTLAEQQPSLYGAIAVHPCDVQHVASLEDCLKLAESFMNHPKCVAVGETGLDYYHDLTHVETQKEFFRAFMTLAQTHNKPVIIHDREAHEDVASITDEFPDVTGVMHCFGGNAAFALEMIERGYLISFAGNVTFKNAKELHEAAKTIPLEWMLLETDAPFLAPVPHRGKPSEPSFVRHVAEFIAELRGISLEEVATVTTENANRLFGVELNERCS